MKIFIIVIFLLFLYYNESSCTFEDSLEVRHSKVRYLPRSNIERSIRDPSTYFWATRDNKYENQLSLKKTKEKNKNKRKENTKPSDINVTEVTNLNSNYDSIKALSPSLGDHFSDLGKSVIKNTTISNDVGNLNLFQTIVRSFGCDVNNGGCSQFCNEYNQVNCTCLRGFVLDPNDKNCLDINECAINNGGCSHACINSYGSYRCECPYGLRLSDDALTCTDINECLLRNDHGPCQGTCTNTFGSYTCSCTINGTRLSPNRHSCEDVDECLEGVSGCSHVCINLIGGFICICPDEMELSNDLKTCYESGGQNDEPAEKLCPPLIPPKPGFFHCSQKKSRSSNKLDSVCELICPNGYKTLGDYRVICRSNGNWSGPQTGRCFPLSDHNFDHRKNYIDFIWDYPKPRISCSASRMVYIKKEQKLAYVNFSPPKTNIEWRHIVSYPPEIKTNLEAYLPQGHHWVVFKATHPETRISAKCIISVIVKKELSEMNVH